jgi:hypothetical protein
MGARFDTHDADAEGTGPYRPVERGFRIAGDCAPGFLRLDERCMIGSWYLG